MFWTKLWKIHLWYFFLSFGSPTTALLFYLRIFLNWNLTQFRMKSSMLFSSRGFWLWLWKHIYCKWCLCGLAAVIGVNNVPGHRGGQSDVWKTVSACNNLGFTFLFALLMVTFVEFSLHWTTFNSHVSFTIFELLQVTVSWGRIWHAFNLCSFI